MLMWLKPLMTTSARVSSVDSERRHTEWVGRERFYFSLFPFLKGGLSLILWKPSVSARLFSPAVWDSMWAPLARNGNFLARKRGNLSNPYMDKYFSLQQSFSGVIEDV